MEPVPGSADTLDGVTKIMYCLTQDLHKEGLQCSIHSKTHTMRVYKGPVHIMDVNNTAGRWKFNADLPLIGSNEPDPYRKLLNLVKDYARTYADNINIVQQVTEGAKKAGSIILESNIRLISADKFRLNLTNPVTLTIYKPEEEGNEEFFTFDLIEKNASTKILQIIRAKCTKKEEPKEPKE